MRNIVSTRRRKALLTLAVCTVAGIAGLVFATILNDATGEGSGRVGTLTPIQTFEAGPPSGALMPGGSVPASIRITNENAASQWIVAVADATGPFTSVPPDPADNTVLNAHLSVNAHPMLNGNAVEVRPGTTEVLLPNTFAAGAGLPLADVGGVEFRKAIRVTLASTPAG
jgi:hypothetical protein